MTVPVAAPVAFSVSWLAGARPELALCDTIPRSRRFRGSFYRENVFRGRDASKVWEIGCLVLRRVADGEKSCSAGEKGGDIGNMLHPTENRNEAGEYSDITTKNNQRKNFNDQVTLNASDEQITAIIRILFYIYKNTN